MNQGAWSEAVADFGCAGVTLRAVLAAPSLPRAVGVVVVAGGPQYRIGSHRQFVHLARGLAACGIPCLRFDARGMGDSDGVPLGFESQDDDIACAVTALIVHAPAVEEVLLFGLCDGASAALLYAHRQRDARVGGLVLMNPWVRSDVTHSRTQVKHYYAGRLASLAFWRKLLRGGVSIGAPVELLQSVWRARSSGRAARGAPEDTFVDLMARGWMSHQGLLLALLSEHDLTAREFEEAVATLPRWQGAWQRSGVTRHPLPGADHTLSRPGNKEAAITAVCGWIDRNWPARRQPGDARP